MPCGKLVRFSSLLLCAVSLGPLPAHAQMTAREADQELNTRYREAMQELPAATREKLRNAQRAWLTFAQKNTAAMRVAASALGISAARCEELEVEEVDRRAGHFAYSKESNEPEEIKGTFERVDADLNAVYARCLSMLAPEAKAALREAQRAWVAYRDANRPFGAQFIAGLTVRRADQLTDFYIKSTTAAISEKRPAKAEPSPPDPFERAR
jgi:uncharacterized protein YecT (DUF1311 family)